MRQGQQNRRGRGRNNNNNNNSGNNNNRKSQNPLTRSFESTGPDVKVRGTPSHVAEKYITLARDALSSGDRVLAENYLQHAEHYNRIILTYREQQMSQGGEYQPGLPRAQTFNAQDPHDGEEFDDENEDGGNGAQPQIGERDGQPQLGGQGGGQFGGQGGPREGMPQRQFEPQQRYDNRPQRHDNRNDHRQHNNQPRQDRDGNRFDRNDRGDRNDNRGEHRSFNRNDRPDRNQDRNQDRNPDRNFDRTPSEPRDFRDDRGPAPFAEGQSAEGHNGNGHRRRERFQTPGAPLGNADRAPPPGFAAQPPMPVLPPVVPVQSAPPPALEAEQPPAFLRRPVRRPRREEPDAAAAAPVPRQPVTDETE